MLLGSISSQQRFAVTDIKALGASQLSGLGYSSNQCYSSILFRKLQENPSSRCEGMLTQRCEEKRVGEHDSMWGRESKRPLAPPFICFFLPLGLPYVNWASPGMLFVLPEVLTLVLGPSFDLLLFYFRGLFPSLSFSHCRSGLLFSILTT